MATATTGLKCKCIYQDENINCKTSEDFKNFIKTCEEPVKYKFGYYDSTFTAGYNKGVDVFHEALTPVKIIYNPPATIVFWKDGDKTVVKCSENEPFNKYHAFCAALAKRIYGNNSQVNKIVNSGISQSEPKAIETPDKSKAKKSSKGSKKK